MAQYDNTLRDLLGIEEDLTGVLPPDGVSKDGFVNNGQSMLLSPLLVESYFNTRSARCISRSWMRTRSRSFVNFRVNLGHEINPGAMSGSLILGANSHLLANDNFIVRQLVPEKPFAFTPFQMRTQWRFNEGYQGNGTRLARIR